MNLLKTLLISLLLISLVGFAQPFKTTSHWQYGTCLPSTVHRLKKNIIDVNAMFRSNDNRALKLSYSRLIFANKIGFKLDHFSLLGGNRSKFFLSIGWSTYFNDFNTNIKIGTGPNLQWTYYFRKTRKKMSAYHPHQNRRFFSVLDFGAYKYVGNDDLAAENKVRYNANLKFGYLFNKISIYGSIGVDDAFESSPESSHLTLLGLGTSFYF